jgi:hypothetical protein
MATSGLVEDEIAQAIGVGKTTLRAKHIGSIKRGKAARKAYLESFNIDRQTYHFLDSATSSFKSHWYSVENGNMLTHGMTGAAIDIDDAYEYWRSQGGHYITTGLSNKFDPEKVAQFAEIILRYDQRHAVKDEDSLDRES